MKILGIETSCDETAVSIIEATGDIYSPSFSVIANMTHTQTEHEQYGGVFPMLAKREHIKNLPPITEHVLKQAGRSMDKPGIDAIAVTEGPGLEPALWVGIEYAKELSQKWNVPIIPVNHMEGHIASVIASTKSSVEFPAVALLISGGHTELVHVNNWKEYNILGETRDDAVGEAFDKVARLLDLRYPGGPKISALAEKARASRPNSPQFHFPRPMIHSEDLDFSFSGLKTSVLYKIRELETLTEETKEEIARAFEDAVVETLITKTKKAFMESNAKTLIIAGGVIANKLIRKEFEALAKELGVDFYIPSTELATDNAIMISIAGYLHKDDKAVDMKTLKAQGNLRLN